MRKSVWIIGGVAIAAVGLTAVGAVAQRGGDGFGYGDGDGWRGGHHGGGYHGRHHGYGERGHGMRHGGRGRHGEGRGKRWDRPATKEDYDAQTRSRFAEWDVNGDGVVDLAERTGLPKIVIGATVVSLGTTLPEAFVSVMAAYMGNPGLALGNGVGSIIADTGLIFGLTCILAAVPVNRYILNRTGWVQVGSATMLVLIAVGMLLIAEEGEEPMQCRGCGCKLGNDALTAGLGLGQGGRFEDAAVIDSDDTGSSIASTCSATCSVIKSAFTCGSTATYP